MIRTLNSDLLPSFDPFVRFCVAGGDENERRHAAVTEGAGHGCSPDMGHGARQDGSGVQEYRWREREGGDLGPLAWHSGYLYRRWLETLTSKVEIRSVNCTSVLRFTPEAVTS
jgi:hypothetical protein